MPCQGCAERREWIKNWIKVGAVRAKALLGGGVVAVAVVESVESIVENVVLDVIEDQLKDEDNGPTDTSAADTEPVIEQTGRRSKRAE